MGVYKYSCTAVIIYVYEIWVLSFGCIPAAASASYILYFSDIAITVAKKVSYVEPVRHVPCFSHSCLFCLLYHFIFLYIKFNCLKTSVDEYSPNHPTSILFTVDSLSWLVSNNSLVHVFIFKNKIIQKK